MVSDRRSAASLPTAAVHQLVPLGNQVVQRTAARTCLAKRSRPSDKTPHRTSCSDSPGHGVALVVRAPRTARSKSRLRSSTGRRLVGARDRYSRKAPGLPMALTPPSWSKQQSWQPRTQHPQHRPQHRSEQHPRHSRDRSQCQTPAPRPAHASCRRPRRRRQSLSTRSYSRRNDLHKVACFIVSKLVEQLDAARALRAHPRAPG